MNDLARVSRATNQAEAEYGRGRSRQSPRSRWDLHPRQSLPAAPSRAVHLARARKLLAAARRAAAEAAPVTPNAAGWRALAEAESARARGLARPKAWSEAAAAWEQLERPPLAAYCRWRQAEALAAIGADATVPLREAHAVAADIGARPLLRELELLADRARLDLGLPGVASLTADPRRG
jgi:hypothetical protein